jgi:hypothetical protein
LLEQWPEVFFKAVVMAFAGSENLHRGQATGVVLAAQALAREPSILMDLQGQ